MARLISADSPGLWLKVMSSCGNKVEPSGHVLSFLCWAASQANAAGVPGFFQRKEKNRKVKGHNKEASFDLSTSFCTFRTALAYPNPNVRPTWLLGLSGSGDNFML